MHLSIFFTFATLALSVQSANIQRDQRAEAQIYTGSGCSGEQSEFAVDNGACVAANGHSEKQDTGANGIRFTCNGYSDSGCKSKVGEVYHCLDKAITHIQCYGSPPL